MEKTKKHRSFRDRLGLGGSIVSILLVIWALVILYPLFWMVMSSMKNYNEIYSNVWSLPQEWLVSNYVTAWEKGISNYLLIV